jgi:hypothetical protein
MLERTSLLSDFVGGLGCADRAEALRRGLTDCVTREDMLLVPFRGMGVIAAAVKARAISWIWRCSSLRSNWLIGAL